MVVEQEKSETLRKHAERAVNGQIADLKKLSPGDVRHLVHELQVHQIELEMQNDELRRAQVELEDSRNRYSNLYNFAPIGYFTFDKNGIILEVNLTGANKLGIERSFLINKPFSPYIDFSSRDVFYLHMRKVFRTKTRQTCEIKLVDKNKNQFDARLESLAVKDNVSNFSQCRTAITDNTEIKKAEEKLQRAHDELEIRVQERTAELVESNEAIQEWTSKLEKINLELIAEIKERKQAEEKIREQAALLDKAQDAIAVRDLEHRLIYWNKGAERLYGWVAEEIIGRNADEILYKEESSRMIEAKKDIIEKGEWTGELHQITKGKKEITVESHWTLVHDDEGKPKSILIINTDITEKKELESQLMRSQRMESIGTLAGGIAHDLNNMLTPMMLSLQMLKEKYKDEQSQKLLTILEQNSHRGANLIKQVMSFARGIEGERKPLQISHIISEIEKIAKETFPKNIGLRRDISDDIWTISGDVTQLHQVIMNLCVNARDAMPDGGVLSITASNLLVDKNFVRMHSEAKVGSYVVVTVSDTGTGIPPKIIDRIFEPFFTTKEHGKGTGLGLSTALAIVKSHDGFINVDSEVGKGTTFRVYLPANKNEKLEAGEKFPELLIGDGEWILVAEDEESIRDITISTLEANGYKVLTANDGAEAVALYAENTDKIKIILMDMMMPVLDGQASIRAIRKVIPEVKIIAVSGLAERERFDKVEGLANAFLPKPYTAEKLLKTIHEVLNAK